MILNVRIKIECPYCGKEHTVNIEGVQYIDGKSGSEETGVDNESA